MHKTFRNVLVAGLVAVGVAACGDDVTVTNPPPPPAPTVKSITVAPNPGTVAIGGTITMNAAVVADEGIATTVTWSSADPTKATVNATTGVVTGVAVGSVAITATSTVNPAVQGNATVNVVSNAATVTGVTVTPPTAALVVGQTIQLAATVLGTNNPAQTVTWTSLSPAVATVNAATGLVTAVGNGTAVIRATSTANTNFSGTMSVTVTTPNPAMVQIQSLTTGNLNTPVTLTNVAGQIEATINIESGDQQLSRVDVLIGGQVIASQSFAVTPAPAEAGDVNAAASTVVLSFNTNQLRKVNNLFVPVVFNGPSTVVANLYVVGTTTPIASNGIPVIIQNADMMFRPTTLVQVATAGPVSNGGNSWYKGNVSVSGANYVSFFPVTPTSITWASTGAVTCGSTGNMVSGTPQTGIALAGTFTCGSTVENAINIGGYTVTAGTAPAADVVYIAAAGYTQAGTAFTLNGENRYNPLTAAAPALANVFIDNKAPVPAVQAGAVGVGPAVAYNDAADQQWVNAGYAFSQDISATDGGSGVLTLEARNYNAGTFVPASSGCSATVVTTGNDYAETTTSTVTDGKRICAWAADALGNFAASGPSNYFGIDKVAPSARFVTATAPATVGTIATVSGTANTTIYSIAAPAPVGQIYAVEANDTRSGFHQGAAITNFPVNMTHTYFGVGVSTSCAIAGYGLPTVLVDAWVRSIEQATYCVATPQYNTWSAFVRDRAGNASTTFARNFAKDDLATADITALSYGQLLYAPGTAAAFNIFATDDLEIIEGTVALVYDGNNDNTAEFVVRYPYAMFPIGTRWDNVLTNVVSGFPVSISNLIGRFDTTATATNLPSGGYASRQNALPDSVYANVRDVASQPDATPLALGLSAVTQFSDSTAAPWASAPAAVFGDVNSTWVVNSATGGVEIAMQRTGTSVTVPYFDSVNLYGVVGGELVLCGTYGAPVLTDNGVFRTWTYTMATPSGSNACVGATGWRAGGVKGNAVMLTQQVAP